MSAEIVNSYYAATEQGDGTYQESFWVTAERVDGKVSVSDVHDTAAALTQSLRFIEPPINLGLYDDQLKVSTGTNYTRPNNPAFVQALFSRTVEAKQLTRELNDEFVQ